MIISVQPARTFEKKSLRLTTVTVMKTKKQNINRISITNVMNGLISLIAVTGPSTSGCDQAQKASPTTKKMTDSTTVIIVDRMILLLSGISSLTVPYTDLGQVAILVPS